MKRYMVRDGILVEDPYGGLIKWDNIISELFNIQGKSHKVMTEALREIRELKKELLSASNEESDWDADNNGF